MVEFEPSNSDVTRRQKELMPVAEDRPFVSSKQTAMLSTRMRISEHPARRSDKANSKARRAARPSKTLICSL